jgi:two-component system, chemotaxis family, protein-glutamate methylesterase/glutaminase
VASIGILVVDDSVVIRRMVATVLGDDPEIDVVGTASNGRIALEKVGQLHPDIIILDVEMPVMDGLATLRALRPLYPTLPVVMFSTSTERGAMATLDALAAGATDYVTKPSNLGSVAASIDRVRLDLIPKIKALVGATRARATPTTVRPPVQPAHTPPAAAPAQPLRLDRVDVVAIGCSTGGPDALSSIVSALPRDLAVPVLVVPHMPALFARLFAERLDRSSPLTVCEASDGQILHDGQIYVAPGEQHLTVHRDGTDVKVRLTKEPPENYCRPSVDVMFRSVASTFGGGVLACVLTGMGRDGALGAAHIHAAGGHIVVQDEASSVVWGMPGAVVAAGLADEVVPLNRIAETLKTAVGAGRHSGTPRVLRASAPVAVAPAPIAASSGRRYGGTP